MAKKLNIKWDWTETGNQFNFVLKGDSHTYYCYFKHGYGEFRGMTWDYETAFSAVSPATWPKSWWSPDLDFSFTIYYYDPIEDLNYLALIYCRYFMGSFDWWKADNSLFNPLVKDLDIQCFHNVVPDGPLQALEQNDCWQYTLNTHNYNPTYDIHFVASRPTT